MRKYFGLLLAALLLVPSLALAIDMANVKLGGDIRFRGYTMDNWADFNDDGAYDDEMDMFRLRASLFAGVDVGDNVTGYIRITDQNYGEGVAVAEGKDAWDDHTSNDVFIENAYIDVKNVLGPISLRLGRQNMVYGSGFVILDGQSQFSSNSIYFDGAKATWDLTELVGLDMFYMKDQENSRGENAVGADQDNNGDDITLMGLYLTSKNGGCPYLRGQQEVYALNREDEGTSKDIWMFGLRLSDKLDFGLDYSAEAALQTGDAYNGEDHSATGYKFDLGYTLDFPIKPRFFGQYVLLSGDEKGGDDYEGWDVFYGGWPQFGDLLAWKYVNMGSSLAPNVIYNPGSTVVGEANYSNLQIMTAGIGLNIDDKIFPKASYSKLEFDETTAYGLLDDDFGDYYQLDVKYVYSKALSFAVYYAVIEPGDAFPKTNQDQAREFFWEAELKF
jgi:hypothetical protein